MDKSIAAKSYFFVHLAAQCNCKKRAGGREPAAGLRHRRAPCCARHLASHHFSCQVIPEIIFHICLSYKRWVIWFTDFIALESRVLIHFLFRNATATIQVFSVSLSLKASKITKNKLSCELPHLSERVLAIDIIPEPIDVFWKQLLTPGARAEDGEKESWRSDLPDAPTHCGSGSNQCQLSSNHIELSGLSENEKPDGAPIWIGHNLFLVRSIPWKDNRTYRKLFNHLDFISATLSVSWWPWRRLCPQRWLFPHICSKVW